MVVGDGAMSAPARRAHATELLALALVPLAMGACALWEIDGAAGFTLLVVLVALALMFGTFEASRPGLRQLMVTVVLASVAAAGRVAFSALPYVKPVSAVAIVTGALLGRRSGFMVGALAALLSNVVFGQGAWTPWQMYAWGLVGYLAGELFATPAHAEDCRGRPGGPSRLEAPGAGMTPAGGSAPGAAPLALVVYGLLSGPLYGLILNGWFVLGFVRPLTWQSALLAYGQGIPFDLVHGVSTALFLTLLWLPWQRSLRRVLAKFDLG